MKVSLTKIDEAELRHQLECHIILNYLIHGINTENPKYLNIKSAQKYIKNNSVGISYTTLLKRCSELHEKLRNLLNNATFDSTHEKLFYFRIYSYLFPQCEFQLKSYDNEYIQSLPVSLPFLPVYIGIISLITEEHNSWSYIKEQAFSIADSLANVVLIKEPLLFENAKNEKLISILYKEWLDLIFPDDMYNLLLTIDALRNSPNTISPTKLFMLDIESNLKNLFFYTPCAQSFFFKKLANLFSPVELASLTDKNKKQLIDFNEQNIARIANNFLDLYYSIRVIEDDVMSQNKDLSTQDIDRLLFKLKKELTINKK